MFNHKILFMCTLLMLPADQVLYAMNAPINLSGDEMPPRFGLKTLTLQNCQINAIALSPCGNWLAIGAARGLIIGDLKNLDSGNIFRLVQPNACVVTLSFCKEPGYLYVTFSGGLVCRYNLENYHVEQFEIHFGVDAPHVCCTELFCAKSNEVISLTAGSGCLSVLNGAKTFVLKQFGPFIPNIHTIAVNENGTRIVGASKMEDGGNSYIHVVTDFYAMYYPQTCLPWRG